MRYALIIAVCGLLAGAAGCDGHPGDGNDAGVGLDAEVTDSGAVRPEPPLADAGPDMRTATGVPVTLDGTGSADPAGAVLRFAWEIVRAPDGSTAVLERADGPRPRLLPDASGAYELALVVSNGSEASEPAKVAIEVVDPGPFVPHFAGTGEIEQIATGDTVYLPPDRRVHVLVLPEGYREEDLDRIYDADVEDWLNQLLAVEPYATFQEAFVVWTRRIASAEHGTAGSPQPNDTAFAVPLTSDGNGIVSSIPSVTAQRVWEVLEDPQFPFPPESFYPAGGKTSRQAKRHFVHLLVFDIDRDRQGLSGRARRLTHPTDPDRVVSAAFARNLPHEFTHAFTRSSDEYMETYSIGTTNDLANTGPSLSNVVLDNTCSTLPWRHLLDGSEYNPETRGLVGAFGDPAVGYHPELRCLMNGTHTNADHFGGNGRLRSTDRMCNWCREMTTFRIYERTDVLPDSTTSFDMWITQYRHPYYERFGVHVPDVVPQENNLGEPHYHACE